MSWGSQARPRWWGEASRVAGADLKKAWRWRPGWRGSVGPVPTFEPKGQSSVSFPIRPLAWAAGQVLDWGCVRGNR